jgi:hypothetical protein
MAGTTGKQCDCVPWGEAILILHVSWFTCPVHAAGSTVISRGRGDGDL